MGEALNGRFRRPSKKAYTREKHLRYVGAFFNLIFSCKEHPLWAFLIKGKADMLFTIYDYKSQYPLDQIKQWSLGGKNDKVKDSLSMLLLVE